MKNIFNGFMGDLPRIKIAGLSFMAGFMVPLVVYFLLAVHIPGKSLWYFLMSVMIPALIETAGYVIALYLLYRTGINRFAFTRPYESVIMGVIAAFVFYWNVFYGILPLINFIGWLIYPVLINLGLLVVQGLWIKLGRYIIGNED